MKKVLLFVLLLIALPMAFAEPSVSVDIPETVELGETFSVVITINVDDSEKFDVAGFIPVDWAISEWDATPKLDVDFDVHEQEFMGEEYSMNHWKFDSVAEEITITYEVEAEEIGEYKFITLWLYPEGFDMVSDEIEIVKASGSSNSITGFTVNPPVAAEENLVFDIEKTKNAFSLLKELVFSIPY